MEPRTNIGPNDKFDTLDFGLDEHDPKVLVLAGVWIRAEQLHVVRLQLGIVSRVLA